MPFQLDPEVAAPLAALLGGGEAPPQAPVGDVKTRRDMCDIMIETLKTKVPRTLDVSNISHKDFHTKTADGHDLLLRWYSKTGSQKETTPAILYIHGGGMIAMSIDHYDYAFPVYVQQTSVPMLAVDFRNAPESPGLIPVGDCYAGLEWLHANAPKLGVDPARIAIMGDSGGGGLAACLAHLVLKKNGPKIAKQILIYPMLDDRNTIPDEHLVPFATWGYNDNATAWQAILGSKCGKDGVLPEEAAARMTVAQAKGLPETYIDVGELDIFRNEDMEYARKLMLAGVSTEFHVYPGVPHAWEGFSPNADVSKRAVANRFKAIMSIKSVRAEVSKSTKI